jgi:hypothetical protein
MQLQKAGATFMMTGAENELLLFVHSVFYVYQHLYLPGKYCGRQTVRILILILVCTDTVVHTT